MSSLRMSESEAARLFGGQPAPARRSTARGQRGGDAWSAMMTLAFLFLAVGILGDWWRLAALGLAWMLAMMWRELRAIRRKLEE